MKQFDLGKLFIGGISWETNEERLREYFSNYGEVLETVVMKDRKTGRPRGFGFIIFADPAIADLVIKERHNIDGKMVEAKKAVPKKDQTNNMSRHNVSMKSFSVPIRAKKIFVGGLASSVTKSEFKLYFEQFGKVTDGVVMYDHITQRPRGFGFITYDSDDAVDKVLLKTFHELNGKMIEVKSAVPKHLSPSPNRNTLDGYNCSLGGINNFLSNYNQGYLPSATDKYSIEMNGKLSPITSTKDDFIPINSDFEMGSNVEGGMSPNFGGNAKYDRSLFLSNSNKFTNYAGFDGENEESTSFFSSITRNLWSNAGINSTNSSGHQESRSGSIGGVNFKNTGLNWGSSPISPPGGGWGNLSNLGKNLGSGCVAKNYNLGENYERNIETTVAPTSLYAASNGGYDATFEDLYGSSSVYEDKTWSIVDSERKKDGAFGYGLGTGAGDIQFKLFPSYIGDYSVSKGQTNKEFAS